MEQEIESETQASSSMKEYLRGKYNYEYPRRGEIRQAIVLSIEPHEIIVDAGAKRDGIVPSKDLELLGEEALAEIEVGDELSVYVLQPENSEGRMIVSINMARKHEDWLRAQELLESGEVFREKVNGFNKGGLLVSFGKLQGFVPASLLCDMPRGLSRDKKMAELSEFVGKELSLKVIEVNPHRHRLILSERAAQREWREQQKEQLMRELVEGEVRQGVVSSLCDFGAFIDLGGADGLVHISELSWGNINHPHEVLEVGQKVDVHILRLDYEKKRIDLSIKRLQPDPWTLIEEKYEIGQIVKGTVTNLVDFGVFARIEPGLEGLIHISELAESDIDHPSQVVQKGDELTLRVISIDPARRRLGLSLRQVPQEEPAEEETEEEATSVEAVEQGKEELKESEESLERG